MNTLYQRLGEPTDPAQAGPLMAADALIAALLDTIPTQARIMALQSEDLAADIAESNNVAGKHPDVVERLTALVKEFESSVEAGKMPPKRRLPL